MPLVKRTDKGSPLSISEMDANWDYVSPGEYLEVTITSGSTSYSDGRSTVASGILSLGSSPKVLLEAPGAGTYYDFDQIIVEGCDSGAYTAAFYLILLNDGIQSTLNQYLLDGSGGYSIVKNLGEFVGTSTNWGGSVVVQDNRLQNTGLTLTTDTGANPTGGTGTILVKIWYKVRTFGTEL